MVIKITEVFCFFFLFGLFSLVLGFVLFRFFLILLLCLIVELPSVSMVKIDFALIATICWEKKPSNRDIFSYLVMKLYR